MGITRRDILACMFYGSNRQMWLSPLHDPIVTLFILCC